MQTCPQCHKSFFGAHVCVYPAKAQVRPVPRMPPPIRTQKARGIDALRQTGWRVPEYRVLSEPPPQGYGWEQVAGMLPCFARPCPVTPCHGFVESRRVDTVEELTALSDEARAVDPLAELVLMRQIPATASAILTPGLLTIGPGHDGATSGHGALNLPIRADVRFDDSLLKLANITDSPYLEVVEGNHKTFAVQLRNGPKVPRGTDYVPTKVTVKHVLLADGDLLAWPKRLDAAEPGTVVYHPGGSLASHYGVHAVTHNIPTMISREPKVGETLQPSSAPIVYNPKLMAQGLEHGMQWQHTKEYTSGPWRDPALFTFFAVHNSAALAEAPLGSFVLGVGMAFAIRLGLAAVAGEARHDRWNKLVTGNRHEIYANGWKQPVLTKRMLPKMLANYLDPKRWGSGFGGRPWARCSQATFDLINACILLCRKPTQKTARHALGTFNTMLHLAHNNGQWFNKFIGTDAMDRAANGDARFLFDCVPALWAALAAPTPDTDSKVALRRWHLLKPLKDEHRETSISLEADATKTTTVPQVLAGLVCVVNVPEGTTITKAQACWKSSKLLHVQYVTTATAPGTYQTANVTNIASAWTWSPEHTVFSMADSGKPYFPLVILDPGTMAMLPAGPDSGLTDPIAVVELVSNPKFPAPAPGDPKKKDTADNDPMPTVSALKKLLWEEDENE